MEDAVAAESADSHTQVQNLGTITYLLTSYHFLSKLHFYKAASGPIAILIRSSRASRRACRRRRRRRN